MIFETDDVSCSSPGLLSRCAFVVLEEENPLLEAPKEMLRRLQQRLSEEDVQLLDTLCEEHLPDAVELLEELQETFWRPFNYYFNSFQFISIL